MASDLGVCKTDWTGHIASIGQIDNSQQCTGLVILADSTVEGTATIHVGVGVVQPVATIPPVSVELSVELAVRPVYIAEHTMHLTLLLDLYATIILKNVSFNDF